MTIIGSIIHWVLQIYLWVLIARMILSWIPLFAPQWRPKGPLLVIAETIYSITDPPLRWLGRFIKPVRVGNIGFDLAFLVLFFTIWVLIRVNYSVFFAG